MAQNVSAQGVLASTAVQGGGSGGSGGPKVSSVLVTDSSYSTLDDTAVALTGGYIKIIGSGFESGCQVLIGNVLATSVTFISVTEIRAQVPATASGTYILYVVNSDGGTAIRVNGITFSATPTWVSDSPLNGTVNTAISLQLQATGAATFSLAAGSSLPSGVSLSSSGLLTGTITGIVTNTTYNFTIVATDSELQDSLKTFAFEVSSGDPYYKYNTLLLSANGANNATNNTFVDSSTNNFAITRAGNTTQGTFTPYGSTWSNYFDGASDYIRKAGAGVLTASGDVTIECWIYPLSTSVIGLFDGGPNQGGILRNYPANKIAKVGNEGTGATFTVTANQWQHFACTYTGGNIKVFINGTLNASGTYTGGYDAGLNFDIGTINGGGDGSFNGYISNFRVTKSILYTTTFTPSTTPLTPITNTSLLTCADNRFVDDSVNNSTLTKNGDVLVQRFSPFSPSLVTPTSLSGYFDGTGDYIQVANDTSNQMGTGDWTAEAWIYITSYSAINAVFAKGGSTTDWFLATNNTSGKLYFGVGNSDYFSTTGPVVSLNTWNHVALVRSGTTLNSYLNGVLGNTQTGVTQNFASTGALNIGRGRDASSNYLSGYVSNARLVKGVAVYTGAFTTPTSPLTATQSSGTNIAAITGTSTSLLTCQSTTFIDNSTNNFTITAFGNSQPTQQNPFGFTSVPTGGYSPSTIGGSAYFDGTGDYLTLPYSASTVQWFNTDYTIEMWANVTTPRVSTATALPLQVAYGTPTSDATYWAFGTNVAGNIYFYYYNGAGITNAVSSMTVTKDTWNHLAMVYNNSTGLIKGYINGAEAFSIAKSGTPQTPAGSTLNIGSTQGVGYHGYISNLRIVQGTTVYTKAFIPSTEPLTAITNTSLLLNFTNAGIIDNTMINNLQTVGDTKISTTQSKFGGSSMFFDGTGDYLTMISNPQLNLDSSNFTIEMWAYPTGNTSGTTLFYKTGCFQLKIDTNRWVWQVFPSNVFVQGGALTANIWQHIALVRNAATTTLYINGTAVASGASVNAINNANTLEIGFGEGGAFVGYIDDFRITKGYARYTANFTPPTTAMLTQ